MDPETKAIHIRLEAWGNETRDGLQPYPSTTVLGRVIEQGIDGALQAGKAHETISEAASEIDGCVAKCCQIDQRVLRFYYQRWLSCYELAKIMKMRERQAQNVLRRARWRVAAHLAAIRICT